MTDADRLDLMWRGGQVTRYHTVNLIRRQSVGEHTYGVMVMLNLLTGFSVSPGLYEAALLHDVPEAETGDVPSPTKRAMASQGWDDFELKVLGRYGLGRPLLTPEEKRLLALADMLEGLRYTVQEVRMGNLELVPVMDRFARYIMELAPFGHTEERLVEHVMDMRLDVFSTPRKESR